MPHKGKSRVRNKEVSVLNAPKKKRRKLKLKSLLKNKKLILKNLPFNATEKDVKDFMKKFGDICDIKLLHKSNGSSLGRGVVQFKEDKYAEKAIQKCNGKEFMGRKIVVDWALSEEEIKKLSSKKKRKKKNVIAEGEIKIKQGESDSKDQENKSSNKKKKNNKVTSNQETLVKEEESNAGDEGYKSSKKKHKKKKVKTEEVEIKEESTDSEDDSAHSGKKNSNTDAKPKNPKKAKNAKKGRLIVRNLPFKVTEDILRNHFKKYGDITEVTLLRKPDGKLVGCGFIQFEKKNLAAKAILECSGKPLLGRTIIVDWAVPKKTFEAANEAPKKEVPVIEIKEEPEDIEEDKDEIKPFDPDANDIVQVIKEKEESGSENESLKEENDSDDLDKKEENSETETDEEDDEDADDEDEDDEDEDDEFEGDEVEDKSKAFDEVKRPRVKSNDVSEGKTVFIKNVPFSATNEDLKACMEQFGTVVYALVCMDPVTEHSKGTAFVKFQKKESAEECLSAGTELTLHDQTLDVYRALNKEDLQNKTSSEHKEKKSKDSRNLYLVKEGVIVAGSKAAVGVSMSDMAKRLKLEQWKSQMLRNLNMYVSKTRLVVHNLPPSWTDKRLRQLFIKHAGHKAVIKEARVMRDMRNVDAQGVGKSKEYGFVSFTNHENTLEALRNINNNPNIFTNSKRPIVAFSIENRAILNIKQKRLEKSRAKNPLYSKNISKPKYKNSNQKEDKKSILEGEDNGEREEYVGVTAQPGKTKMRNRFKLKTQAKVHSQMVHKNKLKEKKQRRFEQQKQVNKEKMKDNQMKKGKKRKYDEEDSTFNSLVNKYKSKLMAASAKKWYDE